MMMIRALLLLLIFGPSTTAVELLPGPIPAVVERVTDGDTVRVTAKIWINQELVVSVRLAGLDAPELYRPKCDREKALGREAKAFVETFLESGRVQLFDIEYGKYARRVVARIENENGGDLGAALISAGLAAPGDERHDWCAA